MSTRKEWRLLAMAVGVLVLSTVSPAPSSGADCDTIAVNGKCRGYRCNCLHCNDEQADCAGWVQCPCGATGCGDPYGTAMVCGNAKDNCPGPTSCACGGTGCGSAPSGTCGRCSNWPNPNYCGGTKKACATDGCLGYGCTCQDFCPAGTDPDGPCLSAVACDCFGLDCICDSYCIDGDGPECGWTVCEQGLGGCQCVDCPCDPCLEDGCTEQGAGGVGQEPDTMSDWWEDAS